MRTLASALGCVTLAIGESDVRQRVGREQKGEGSVFTVVLPVNRAGTLFPHPENRQNAENAAVYPDKLRWETRPRRRRRMGERPGAETDATVLVVEDNKDIVLYIKSLLPMSYKVIRARTGRKALTWQQWVPDLIVSDVMMPLKDGFSLCREVKSSELLNHIPVILLTAKPLWKTNSRA